MSTLLAVFETSGIIDTILSVIGTILYPLFSIIFVAIAGIQHVFFAFAGIDKMSYGGKPIGNGNTGAEDDTGIVYYLLNNELVKNMIMSIMLLALFLVIVFTVMAFIKNAYAAKPKGWKDIIGNAIKGLANFIFLPVCCLLGIWLGNILLQAINGATSYAGATSMERKLFIACSYNANLFRCDETPDITWGELKALADNKMVEDSSKTFAQYHGLTFPTDNLDAKVITAESSDEDRRYYAELVDQIFSETTVSLNAWGTNSKIHVTDTGTGQVSSFNTYLGVANFYSLWQFNYLVLIVGGIFMLYVLGSLAFAMIRRLFLILLLFIVSPAVCALYPLDEGKAVGSWKTKFIEQVLSAYGAVAGLNIFFSLVPLIDKISIFDGTSWWTSGWGVNDIVQIFILVVGLMVVKEFISLITGFVGGDDAYGKGSGLMKSAAKEVGGRAGKFATGTAGAFGRAKAAHDAGGSWWGSMAKSAGKDLLGVGKDAAKTLTGGAFDYDAMDKAKKEGKKGYEEDFAKAEGKVLAKEFSKLLDGTALTSIVKDDEGKETTVASIPAIANMMKEASYHGVEDNKAYGLIQDKLAKSGIDMSKADMKKEIAKYNKQQEEEKMKRMAAYNARGAEFENLLDADMVTIKTTETAVNAAKANFDAVKASFGDKWDVESQKAINQAKEEAIPRGSKKGDTQSARRKAIEEMERIVESGDTDSSKLDPSKFSGVFKDAIATFKKELESASDGLKKIAEAADKVKSAEAEHEASVKKLDSSIQKVSSEFSTVQEVVNKMAGTAGKSSDELEKMVKAIKQDIRQ